MKQALAPTRDWTKVGEQPVEALIEAAWERLVDLTEAPEGERPPLSQAQIDYLYRREEEMGEHPIGRNLLLRMLNRAVANPQAVGVDLDAFATYPCRCGPGRGMELLEDGTARPCAVCNPGGRRIWAECYLTGCHGCEKCRAGSRRRGMAGDHRAEADEHRADERAQRVREDLR